MRRRAGGDGAGPVEVELVEDDLWPDPTAPGRGGTDGRAAGRGTGESMARRRRAGVVALALAVLLAGYAVVDARQDAYRARLAEVPGVVGSLDEPLGVTWRREGTLVADLGGLLLVGHDRTGALVAVEPSSGEPRWARERLPGSAAGRCVPSPDPRVTGEPVGDGARLYCVAERRPEEFGTGEYVSRLVAIDPADGLTLTSSGVEGRLLDVAGVDGDVVVVAATSTAGLSVLRWDGARGTVVWHRRGDLPVGAATWATSWTPEVVRVDSSPPVTLALATGEVLVDEDAVPRLTDDLPDGGVLEWRVDGAEVTRGIRVASPIGRALHLTGLPWVPEVDDGSFPSTVIVRRDDVLLGFDVSTRDRAWAWRLEGDARPLARVSGMLVSLEGEDVVVRALADGRVRWRAPGADPRVATDGWSLLLVRPTAGREELVAHDLDDGYVTWRRALPEGARDLVVLAGGELVLRGEGWTAGLAPAEDDAG